MMNGRGGRARPAEIPLAPKASALPTELHPETGGVKSRVRPDRMTVRADELAFCELLGDEFSPQVPHGGDLAELRRTWKVVPLHRLRWKHSSAIGARFSGLHLAQPCLALIEPGLFVFRPALLVLLPVVMVVGPAAGLAPWLVAIAAFVPVKLRVRLCLSGPLAALHPI